MNNIINNIKKFTARTTAGIMTVAALAAAPLAASVPVHAQETQNIVYGYDYETDHVTIDGCTAYAPGEYMINDTGKDLYLVFTDKDLEAAVVITVAAGEEYQLRYKESADDLTVSTNQYWVYLDLDVDSEFYYFAPDTAF